MLRLYRAKLPPPALSQANAGTRSDVPGQLKNVKAELEVGLIRNVRVLIAGEMTAELPALVLLSKLMTRAPELELHQLWTNRHSSSFQKA